MFVNQCKFVGLSLLILSLVFTMGCETVPNAQSDTGVAEPSDKGALGLVTETANELKQLRERVQLLELELSRNKKRMNQLYDDIDIRLRKLERRSDSAAGASAPTPDTAESSTLTPDTAESSTLTPDTAESSVQPQTSEKSSTEPSTSDEESTVPIQVEDTHEDDREVYDKAFRALRDGEYEDAIAEFGRLVEQFPNSQLVDDGWYWIAEAHYVTQNYEGALPVFEKVVKEFPDSQRAPDAMLKIGYVYYEVADYEKAANYLNQVVELYPASRSAFSASAVV